MRWWGHYTYWQTEGSKVWQVCLKSLWRLNQYKGDVFKQTRKPFTGVWGLLISEMSSSTHIITININLWDYSIHQIAKHPWWKKNIHIMYNRPLVSYFQWYIFLRNTKLKLCCICNWLFLHAPNINQIFFRKSPSDIISPSFVLMCIF